MHACRYEAKLEEIYPPFTTEKQIELIKLLARKRLTILYDEGTECYTMERYNGKEYFSEKFEDVLAIIVTRNIDKLDNAKVKEILE